jgi:hypothetical protein
MFSYANGNIKEIRIAYKNAIKSKENVHKFIDLINNCQEKNITLEGYKVAAKILEAKYIKDKEKRKIVFKTSTEKLDNLIQNNPNHFELCLIRLSIQENTPKFLKYQSNINTDKAILIEKYKNQEENLKDYFLEFVAQSKSFNTAEKKMIR